MRIALLAVLSALTLAGVSRAQTPLTTSRVASGLSQPIFCCAPEGDDRLFIMEQGGRIKILQDGVVLPTPFLNLTGTVNNSGECGLLGLAFHPNYRENGQFFVHYSLASACNSRIFMFTRSASDPNVADPTPAFRFNYAQPFTNHNGGCLQFGPDGYLYVSLGDGGSGGDPGCRAQNLNNLLGSILRIDIDGVNPGVAQYLIPPTNPFVGVANTREEIFHYGLRNPWRFSFDRETGDMYIGDVGQNGREEIDVAPAGSMGLNFGWKIMEGTNCYSTSACAPGVPTCNDPSLVLPVRQENYGTFTSITGGYVYRGCAIPDLQGTYFYADYNTDIIRSFVWDSGTNTATNLITRTVELSPPAGQGFVRDIASFGEDGHGELYICDRAGEIFKIVPAATPAGLVDCDGDGKDDACELATNAWSDLDSNGVLDTCQSFSARYADVSASAQTAQEWFLHPGAQYAGSLYLVAGSFSGTAPGFALAGFTIPLNIPDPYFNISIASPNQPPLVNSLGVLSNPSGEAQGALDTSLLALPPSLIGGGADHAFAVVAGGAVTFVSNPIHVNFLP